MGNSVKIFCIVHVLSTCGSVKNLSLKNFNLSPVPSFDCREMGSPKVNECLLFEVAYKSWYREMNIHQLLLIELIIYSFICWDVKLKYLAVNFKYLILLLLCVSISKPQSISCADEFSFYLALLVSCEFAFWRCVLFLLTSWELRPKYRGLFANCFLSSLSEIDSG